MDETEGVEPKKEGVTNRQGLYAKVAKHEDKIITTLLEMLDSTNESVKMGAAKTLLGKILPDQKAVEVAGADGGPIQINLLGKYVSPGGWTLSPPTGSTGGSDQIQNVGLAPQSPQDINPNREDKT